MGGPLGTLIVVVLKARNLPNKQRIGKQDPFATCEYLSHIKRTKVDKRGGQHPVWDEELRFKIYENPKDLIPSRNVRSPIKSSHSPLVLELKVNELRLAVYAHDSHHPELIGEGIVDITETLKKGEFDDWVTITHKDKYQGEIYLEMTFYSAKPPPQKQPNFRGPRSNQIPRNLSKTPKLHKALSPVQSTTPKAQKVLSPVQSPTKVDISNLPPCLRAGKLAPKPEVTTIHTLPLPGEPDVETPPASEDPECDTGSACILM
ncbi:C2 domain-containing protein [Melampsora americana]|nr:C2 domain-containing protein [Melampsora americana]